MKKNIILTATVLIATVLVASSCKKVLNTKPFNIVSEDVVWANTANAETFIYSTYNSIMNDYAGGGAAGDYDEGPSTDGRTVNTLGFDGIYGASSQVFTETTNQFSDYGFNNWAEIRRCNQIITKVGASAGISAADKVQLIAEGKFLRAMSYYNVARSIGRIVWIDTVLTPTDNLLLPSTANPTETYQYIIKDLEDAVADLPTTKVAGRANKYAAAAILSEVCLQAMAYENYPAAPTISATDPLLAEAITNAQLVINQGGYALETNYGSMFNDIDPTSNEIILGIYQTALNTTCDGTPMQLMVPNVNNGTLLRGGGTPLFTAAFNVFEAWVQHGPTQNIADDYLVIDKNNPGIAVPWNQTSQYNAAVDESAAIPTSLIPQASGETSVQHGIIKPGSTETVWSLTNQNRDARFNASILSDSSSRFYGEILTTGIQGNATRWLKINGFGYYLSLSNMYWRKGVYNNVSPRIYVGVPTDYHYVITRLGRVYLNLAEAYLLKGDVPEAVTALNQTRTVHGQLPASNAATITDAWTDYKRERRVDLVLENDYYWSLLRWGRYGGAANHGITSGGTIPELTEVPRVMDISKNRLAFSVVQGPFFSSNNVRVFNNQRRYLMPISQNYLIQNPKFGPQNPGW